LLSKTQPTFSKFLKINCPYCIAKIEKVDSEEITKGMSRILFHKWFMRLYKHKYNQHELKEAEMG
jgi:hypothetical protein